METVDAPVDSAAPGRESERRVRVRRRRRRSGSSKGEGAAPAPAGGLVAAGKLLACATVAAAPIAVGAVHRPVIVAAVAASGVALALLVAGELRLGRALRFTRGAAAPL